MDVSLLREQLEPHLRGFLLQKQALAAAFVTDPVLHEWLAEPARLIDAGGKRVRPLFCVLGYLAAGGAPGPDIFRAACSLELFHVFALIHDDIMDHGRERHGVPTAHRYIGQRLQALQRLGDVEHVGTAQAIILGDLLFSWSVEALLSSGCAPEAIDRAKTVFFAMSDEVMVGQMLDIDLTTRAHSSRAEIKQKMCLKTAGYTFIKPFQLGVALAGGESAWKEFAESFGMHIGLAFQIQDDLQDAFVDVEKTGKTPLSDVRDHQHSLLTQHVLEQGSAQDQAALFAVWGKPEASPAAYEALREVFCRSGAVHAAHEVCLEHLQKAEQLLEGAALASGVRLALQQILAKAVSRSWLADLERRACEPYGGHA